MPQYLNIINNKYFIYGLTFTQMFLQEQTIYINLLDRIFKFFIIISILIDPLSLS